MIDCTPKYFSAIDQNILLACKSLKYSFFSRHKWLTCMRIFWPYRLDTVGVMKLETNYNLINKLLKKIKKISLESTRKLVILSVWLLCKKLSDNQYAYKKYTHKEIHFCAMGIALIRYKFMRFFINQMHSKVWRLLYI